MARHSNTSRPRLSKPRPDFPLFPHATGRWAKKVRGKLRYFGKVADDPHGEKALDLWLAQKDALLAVCPLIQKAMVLLAVNGGLGATTSPRCQRRQ